MDTLNDITAIPVVTGLTQVVKEVGLPDNFVPVVALVLGLLAGLILTPTNYLVGIGKGVMIGLSASGLYNHVQAVKTP